MTSPSWSRIVVRWPNWLGDALMARPFLRGLRRTFPGARVAAIAPAPFLELLASDASADEGWALSRATMVDVHARLRAFGAEAAFNAEPDGYTLLSAPPPPLVINQSLYPKLAYDAAQFVPISIMGIVPNALVAVTKNRYDFPLSSPTNWAEVDVVSTDSPDGNAMTVYESIAAPPSMIGGSQLTEAL